jgi:hypothetical protein
MYPITPQKIPDNIGIIQYKRFVFSMSITDHKVKGISTERPYSKWVWRNGIPNGLSQYTRY